METSAATSPPRPTSVADEASKIKRAHQACLNCRKRKSRCLLDADGSIPCLRCKRDNLDCVLGGSNRGGRRVRKPKPPPAPEPQTDHTLTTIAPYAQEEVPFPGIGTVGTSPWTQHDTIARQSGGAEDQLPRSESATSSDEIPFPNLQNPSDALGILARVAESSSGEGDSSNGRGARLHMVSMAPPAEQHARASIFSYKLLDSGALTVATVCYLLSRYHQNYHPYYPLAPVRTFDTTRLGETAKKEPHLLTAILVIASKDLIEEAHIYESCSEHMKSLVSDLAAGGDADVEAVEALLLLAEWAPYTQRGSGKVGKGEEDKESWMHVGLALRIAYFLALDKYSFRIIDKDRDRDPDHDRKRLIWTASYVSDRHISIRIGKAFWSRGPGPMTTLRREDYPTLQPKSPNDEDYASIFQANLELTQLFSNVHDVLYSNPGSSFRSHLSGSYIKFIDDFRSAIYGWKSVWGTLTCSPPLKACLLISYDYLRLYVNAFAFQATVRRAMPAFGAQSVDPTLSQAGGSSTMQAPQRVFCNNVGAVGDARFIYEGLDAAKAILTTANNFVDPEKSLRYMPLRYYLYLVYAGVFLYRARCTGVISGDEDRAIRAMINETVSRLQRSSPGVGPTTGNLQHPGSRYSQLLKLLWAKVPRKDKMSRNSFRHPGTHAANPPLEPNGHAIAPSTVSMPSPSQAGSMETGESPAETIQMGDFGWTDLGAVGDFAINGNGTAGPVDDSAFWNGFLPLDMGWPTVMNGQGDNVWFDGNELGMAF